MRSSKLQPNRRSGAYGKFRITPIDQGAKRQRLCVKKETGVPTGSLHPRGTARTVSSRPMVRSAFFFPMVAFFVGCHRVDPPSPPGVDTATAALPSPRAVVPDAAPPLPAKDAADHPAQDNHPQADAGVDPGTLAQTKDKPQASGAAIDARVALLWEAIVNDDPERALPFFFPRTAYEQVKAIPDPSSDWRRRLVAAYKRDIHALHRRFGETPTTAKFVRVEIPEERARWVLPDEETNRLGYYRVYGTRVIYEEGGKERAFDIRSLISWRGEWYVVHLSAFK